MNETQDNGFDPDNCESETMCRKSFTTALGGTFTNMFDQVRIVETLP